MLQGATDDVASTAAAAGAALGKVLSTSKKPVKGAAAAVSPAGGPSPSGGSGGSRGVKSIFKRMTGTKPASSS